VAAGVAVATILTGCSSGAQTAPTTAASSAEKPTEITLYSTMVKGTPLGTIQADVITRFEAETGIKVTVTEASGDGAMDAYEASVAAGTEADLVNINAQGKVSTSWRPSCSNSLLKSLGPFDPLMTAAKTIQNLARSALVQAFQS